MQASLQTTRLAGSDVVAAEGRPTISGANTAPIAAHAEPQLSVVVPTRNEAGNIEPLVDRVTQALQGTPIEIIFVDDSDDDTVAVIEAVRISAACDVRYLHRPPAQRGDGLSGAVVEGLRMARSPWVCVMDADLQHPPEIIPCLCEKASETDADLVVASRYCAQGGTERFSRGRIIISRGSTLAARLMFPGRLDEVTDPMTGFFLVRKAALDLDRLRPHGFKILLEILVRTPELRISEIGFHFGERHAGESKASIREGMRYFAHLCRLRFGEESLRFIQFLLVGITGLLVNTLLLALATEVFALHYLLSAVFATQGSTIWNFLLSERWVFSDRQRRNGRFLRLVSFMILNNVALIPRGPILYLFTSLLGIHYVISNLISLGAMTLLRYMFADHLIWRRADAKARTAPVYNYDIHGIITVVSEVMLPELERFGVATSIDRPTIRVSIEKSNQVPRSLAAPAMEISSLRYDEGLGRLGFGIQITPGETITILAAPLLRWSPHVLYTNVVEPILRWTFVEKGYALVHGACISFGSTAYMITARTDTGKTTTILRLLDRQRRATDTGSFLSDDLTLLSSDGHVLTYPKPLTISHHTVAAIDTPRLSLRGRLTLPLQSRLHSREGRRFALWLSQHRLPVATINTIVQLLIPPPKYHVDQLVPNARLVREAYLGGLIVIERGADEDIPLDPQAGLDILLSNCEDAYGFPPYETIKTFLHGAKHSDLPARERQIIADALQNLPSTLIRSSRLDWSRRIPMLVGGAREREREEIVLQQRSIGEELPDIALGLSST